MRYALLGKVFLGGFAAIFLLAKLSTCAQVPLLMAPFGATCVLLFAVPESPLSQPLNVIGGHVLSSLVGVLSLHFLDTGALSLALSVASAIALMVAFRVVHPPAGADPIVILLGAKTLPFLLFPVLTGSVLLVLTAMVFHHFANRGIYPKRS